MILISFHGGKGTGTITNVFAYSTNPPTNPPQPNVLSYAALSATAAEAELRAMVFEGGYLYVADGAKKSSIVTYYQPVANQTYLFDTPATFVEAKLSKHKGDFQTSISHPYSIVFGNQQAFVANQDTNAVALVAVNTDGSGTLNSGSQSKYLSTAFPSAVFLDGTFAASQVAALPNVETTAPDVPPSNGGLAVWPLTGKVAHSVRDVAISGDLLLVCDEAGGCLRVYSLSNGDYLNMLCGLGSNLPTHLQIVNGGMYVSAGAALYWAPIPNSDGSSAGPFVSILPAPSGSKIAGLAFNVALNELTGTWAGTVYVALQTGAQGGSIMQYTFAQSSSSTAPTLTNGAVFVDQSIDKNFTDTPEFLVYQPDPA